MIDRGDLLVRCFCDTFVVMLRISNAGERLMKFKK